MKPEEIAQWVINNRYPKSEQDKISDFEMFNFIKDSIDYKIPSEHEIEEIVWSYKKMKTPINTKGITFKMYCEFLDGAIWLLKYIKKETP